MEPKNTPNAEPPLPEREQGGGPADPAERWARLSRTVALYTALGTGLVFASVKLSEASIREESRLTYGTREEPRFRIGDIRVTDEVRSLSVVLKETASVHEPLPYNVVVAGVAVADFDRTFLLIERKLAALAPDTASLEGWRARFASSEESSIVVQLEFNEKHPHYGALCEALQSLGDAADLNVLNLDMQVLNFDLEVGFALERQTRRERLENIQPRESVSSTEYAKRIFERVTGRALPASITIEHADIAKFGVTGTAESRSQRITVEPMSFSQEVSTLCHEMGHMIARPGEEFEGERGFFTPILGVPRSAEKAVLEEASAYAFERVCIGAIPDEPIRKRAAVAFENQMLFQAKLFFRGEREVHCEAGVVAEAACRVLGGAPAAYEYLSATDEISPAIRSAIEETRREWEETPVGRCKKAADSLRSLSERVRELRERFDPKYSR